MSTTLEWVPGLIRRDLHIADVGAQAPANTCTHRRQLDVVLFTVVHAYAPDKIGTAINSREPLKQALHTGQVINQRKHLGRVAAPVKSQGWPCPVDFLCIAGDTASKLMRLTQKYLYLQYVSKYPVHMFDVKFHQILVI